MRDIDFLITAMDRYHYLQPLLDSIFKYYPKAKVTVADQSKEIDTDLYNNWKDRDLRVFPLPYDCGLSYARNVLVENTIRKYKLILEDDFLFTDKTRIEKLRDLMEVADIAGGAVVRQNNKILNFGHYFDLQNETLYQIPDGDKWREHKGIVYKPTGCVSNFALFNRDVFKRVKWDVRLKIREHQHFFYRARNEKMVYTEDVRIKDNKKGSSNEMYKALKGRDRFWKVAIEDLKITKVKYLNGMVVELKDGKIWKYKE